jgi:hypothetical protein
MIRILMTPEALGQFEGLQRTIKERMRKLVERLADWPAVSGVKPLRGTWPGGTASAPAITGSGSASRAKPL